MERPEASRPPADGRAALPPAIEEALSRPALPRRGWSRTIAPSYIALFLWVVYFDQLGRRTLAIGGLLPSVLGAGAGALLCYLLLYYVPAMWGQKTGRPLAVLATSTFGATGAVWFATVLIGLAQVVWLAVATFYAIDWSFQGFISLGLLDARSLRPLTVGGKAVASPLFLITALAWIYAAALVGRYFVRVIAALMNVYPIFPALMLAVATIATLRGVPGFRPLALDPATSAPVVDGEARAFVMMIQLIFGFFATAGVQAADWGMVSLSPRDVRAGGLVGVVFAPWIVATLSLLIVAGTLGQYVPPAGLRNAPGVGNFSVRVALLLGVNERLAGTMFLVFGLASLAPTCYAAFVLGDRLSAVWPRVSRLGWIILGTAVAWLLVATGVAIRLEEIFTILGAVFAPMAGALAADYVRARGRWPGPRRGVNPSGVVAWVVGLSVGLVPLVATAGSRPGGRPFQPAAVFAFASAFVAYTLLAALGAEPPAIPLPESAPVLEAIAIADAAEVAQEAGGA